jgi:hypothetical protein
LHRDLADFGFHCNRRWQARPNDRNRAAIAAKSGDGKQSRIGKLTKPDYSKIGARFLRWRRKRRSPLKRNTKRFGCVTN